jgi:histidyl-tRNA synthetase
MGERLKNRLSDWRKLLSGLDAMGLGNFVQVDLGVVRGLAYYTGFVFEAFDRKGDLRALAGGGRYNDLIKKLGGPDLPAVGFAIGDVTTGILLEERGKMPAFINAPDVYVLIGEEMNGRLLAFPIINELRVAGLRVDYPLKEVAFGKQFKLAADSGAKLALIYGGDERAKGVMKIRDLTERNEREVPREQVVAAVREFFSGGA